MEAKKIFSLVFRVAKEMGVEVYAVGGIIRDQLLCPETTIADFDFVVIGSGLKLAKKCAIDWGEEAGSLVEFPDFDTARFVFADGAEVEFAGARKEIYDSDSRKPIVSPADGLSADLARRDFTVNALARKLTARGLKKEIVDKFDGQGDLKKKLIKTPLPPDQTFIDDPLRILRAARFAAKLDFSIEAETLSAMKKNRHRLKIVSAERIKEELFKLLATKHPSVGLWILYETGVLQEILPEISALYGVEEMYGQGHKNNLAHTFKVVDNVAEKTDKVLLRYTALLHDVGKPGTKEFIPGRGWAFDMHEHLGRKLARQIGHRLRLSRDEIEYSAKLVRWHQQPIALMDDGVTDSAVRRLVVSLGDELEDLLILCQSDITTGNPHKLAKRLKNYEYLSKRIAEVLEKDRLRAFQSPVRGDEIMKECGLSAGPTVGKIKKAIEEAILDGVVPNEYEPAKKYFLEIKDNFLRQAEDWEKK